MSTVLCYLIYMKTFNCQGENKRNERVHVYVGSNLANSGYRMKTVKNTCGFRKNRICEQEHKSHQCSFE